MSESIIAAIDKELEQLHRVRAMLAGTPDTITKATEALPGKRRGRPTGSGKSSSIDEPVKARRVMSEEGKAKIAAAQKKRWASVKRAAKKAANEAESIAAAKKTTKLASAKNAVANKALAKKAAPTKAPTAKKVTAKKVAAKKAVATKTPAAKKVTAKKSVVKTASAKSTPAPTTPMNETQAPVAA